MHQKDSISMKPKLLLCLALVVSGVLIGCSSAPKVRLARLSQLEVIFNYFWLVWKRPSEGRRADFLEQLRLVQTYPLP
jgi:hypothetical protein